MSSSLSPAPGHAPERGSLKVLLLSGACGALFGALAAEWQWAVEIAQLHAGIVRYPSEALATGVQAHLFSVVHQIVAGALAAGVTEYTCSLVLSMLMAALSFQAAALGIYALTRNVPYAAAASVVIAVTGAVSYGVTYPVTMMPTSHSYGALGLSSAILAVALIACGSFRAGAFLLGIVPAIHPALGMWVTGLVVLAGLSDRNPFFRAQGVQRAYQIGLAVTVASLAVHLATAPDLPAIPAAEAERYFRGMLRFWDNHRGAIRWSAAGFWFNLAAAAIAALLWRRAAPPARLLLSFAVAGGVLATAANVMRALPVEQPRAFIVAMPGRLLNPDIFLLTPFLAAVAFAGRARLRFALPVLFFAGLAVSDRSPAAGILWAGSGWRLPQAALLAGLSALGVLTLAWRASSRDNNRDSPSRPSGVVWVALTAAAVVGVSGIAGLLVSPAPGLRTDRLWSEPGDRIVFDTAARGTGVLAVAPDVWLVQLRTRRPVLLDVVTVDTVSYAPAGGPFAERVLQDVYGLSLFEPTSRAGVPGQVSRSEAMAFWQQMSVDDWRAIRQRYGVTEVVAHLDWPLALPTVAAGTSLKLSRIPE